MRKVEIKREYRVLALAVVIFIAGASFFFYDKTRVADERRAANLAASDQGGEQPALKGPAPSSFNHFMYAPGKMAPAVKDTCHDAYAAVLLFRASLDYRKDAARASFNRAFACTKGMPFQFSFSKDDTKNLMPDEYYIIVADEGSVPGSTWYNPR